MPIYEYKCKQCGEKFETRLNVFHNRTEVKCPKCGKDDPERVFSPFQTGSPADSSCSAPSSTRYG
jgi:putative FmdB family regulatory protein